MKAPHALSPLREAIAQRRPFILDGAMGTMIQSYHLSEADYRGTADGCSRTFPELPGQQTGNNDLLCLTRPDIIADIHRRYLEAGADIITTNTFNAQRISLADYGCEHLVRDINLAAVRIARESCAQATRLPDAMRQTAGPFVVGSVGPTNKSLSMSPDINDPALRAITFDNLAEAYTEQMTALIEGGVDALLLETCFDTLNAKAALYAAEEAMCRTGRRCPIMLSATVSDRAGRLLSGQTLEAFFISVSHAPLLSIGLNCSFGAEEMLPHIRTLRKLVNAHNLRARVPIYISAHPNAGLPNQLGQYDETPELMASHISPLHPSHQGTDPLPALQREEEQCYRSEAARQPPPLPHGRGWGWVIFRPGASNAHARSGFHQCRRTMQCRRFAQVPASDQGEELRGSSGDSPQAGGGRCPGAGHQSR